jgi:hypothetical protein
MNVHKTGKQQWAGIGLSLALAGLLFLALGWVTTSTSQATHQPMAHHARPLSTEIYGVITQSTTWTAAGSPYHLTDNVIVTRGVTLTIEPGVTVMSYVEKELKVLGHLEAIGAPTQPITFTSVGEGWNEQWNGLFFDGGTGRLNNVIVRRSGGRSARIWAAVAVRNVLTGEVRLESSQVRDNHSWAPGSDYGLYVENSRVVVSDTLFTGNGTELWYDYGRKDAPIFITGTASVVTLTNNVITGNIRDRIVLAPGAMMANPNVTLTRQPVMQAYELEGDFTIPPTVTLTIEPGVTVMSYREIELDVLGRLEAIGTPTQPITFTSVGEGWNEQWKGLLFDGGTGRLNNVVVRRSGQRWNNAGIYAAVAVRNVLTGEVRLESSQVRDNYSWAWASDYGLYAENSRVVVSDTLFTGNGTQLTYDYKDAPIFITGTASVVTLTNNVITGNIRDRIVLAPGAMMANPNVTLTRQPVMQAYELEGDFTVPPTVTLTIEPGITLMAHYYELTVKGRLVSPGTPSEPITLTSRVDERCRWKGLVIDGGSALLSNTSVLNGGSDGTSVGTRSIIAVRNALTEGLQMEGGQVRGIGCIIGNVSETGIHVINSQVAVTNTTFTKVGDGLPDCALNITGDSSRVQLTGNAVDGNGGHGVCVSGNGSTVIMARNTLILNKGDAVRSEGIADITVGSAPGQGNDIVGNEGYGVNQITVGGLITATYNWWGDPTGPYHATLNPGGKGGRVSDRVIFDPWATNWSGSAVREVRVQVTGPRMASPGGAVHYAVTYMNLMTTTVQSATLVLNIPGLGSYMESTGNGIYWPQRHQVFWKLGDLPPGGYGTVSAQVRYQWGIPEGTREGVVAFLIGANLSQPMLDLKDYLDYVPVTVLQETALTPTQFDQARQSSPDLDALYSGALASGFLSGTYSSLSMSTGQVVTQAVLLKPDLSGFAVVFQESDQAMAMTVDRTSVTIATASGGITINLQTGAYQQWNRTAQATGTGALSFGQWDCLLNCAVENVGGAILGEIVQVIGRMQTIQACVDWIATGDSGAMTGCLLQVPGAGIVLSALDCYNQYRTDPDACRCKDHKYECKRVWWSPSEGVWKTPCNLSRGVYESSQAEMAWYCPFCTLCVGGIGGNPMDRCQPAGPDPCPSGTTQALAGRSSTSGNPEGKKTCLVPARDPNALYGPEGDLLPGQRVTYTITYENEGAGRAYGVYVTDQLGDPFDPSTLTLYGGGQYIPSSRKIIWIIGELGPKGAPDSEGVVSFTVRLRNDLPGGTPVINQAVVYFPSVPEETPTNPVVNVIQPVAAIPQRVETSYMQPVSIPLQGLDVGGWPLTFTVATQPLYGYLSVFSATATYTPAANFVGVDGFTFKASNGITESRPAEVQITVRPLGDATPPEIYWTEPPRSAVGVVPVARPVYTDTSGPLYAPFVIVQFSEPVSATTVTPTTIRMVDGHGVQVPVRVDYDGITRQATLSLRQPLQYTMRYTVTVTGGVKDLAGNSLSPDYMWSFRTVNERFDIYLPLVLRNH